MFSFNLARWLKSWYTRRRPLPIEKRRRTRLAVEMLEDRITPSVQWTGGGGANTNWSDPANWGGTNIATLATAPDLVFPSISAATSSNDDIATSTDNAAGFTANSISMQSGSTAGWTLTTSAGVTLTLGSTTNSPFIKDQSGASDTIDMAIAINGSISSTNNLEVDSGTTLTFSGGSLSGTSQLNALTVGIGTGTIVFNQADSFTGSFTINAGSTIVEMENGSAFGKAANPVIVGNDSEIQVSGGITANYNAQLTGSGTQSDGSTSPLMSTAGNNVWNGSITFETSVDANMYFNVQPASTFTVNGVIYDTGTAGNLYKWGQGTLDLDNANQYHGETDVEDGVLAIEDPLALGPSDTQQVYTHTSNVTGTGTLEIDYTGTQSPNDTSDLQDYILENPTLPHSATNPYVGFVVDYQLESLLGVGFGGDGTLYNFAGDNAWSGPVNLDYAAPFTTTNEINVNVNSELDITGILGDRPVHPANPAETLDKIGGGDLILEPTLNAANLPADSYALITLNDGTSILSQDGANANSSQGVANTFIDSVNIEQGIVTLEDSQGLGPTTNTALTTVSSGASLHLVANVGHEDSLTDTSNELLVDAPLTINGVGATAADEGALDSISGINTYGPNTTYGKDVITIGSQGTYIGVDPDPTETASNLYFTNDYSLTITGGLINNNGGYSGPTITLPSLAPWIAKVGDGQLILPNSNLDFYGNWEIKAGWVTVQNQYSLGGSQKGLPNNVPQGALFTTQVDSGAALMLLPFNPDSNMSLGDTNLILQGDGVTHAFSLIDDMGALENLAGVNTIQGDVTLEGQVGIGVEEIYPGIVSDLTFNGGEITQAEPTAASQLYNKPIIPAAITIPNTLAAGGVSQYTQVIDTGSTSFTGTINYAKFVGDEIQVYYGPIGTPGSHIIASTGVITSAAGALPFNDTAAIGDGTEIEIVVDQDDPVQTLSGILNNTINVTGLPSTSQLYVGELVTGAGIPAGDTIASINANGTAITLTSAATVSTSETLTFGNSTWSYSGSVNINSSYFVGGIIKQGSQRLVMEGTGIFQGGVDIRQGVVLDENETGLGEPEYNAGTPGQMFGTTVEAGAGLILSPTLASLDGGLSVGPATWANHLTLNGTGNSTFGVAPLSVLADDNLWSGGISLNSAISITYQGSFADTALPADPISVNFSGLVGGTDPTIDDTTTMTGSASQDDVETLTFGGSFASVSGTFTMTVYDGVGDFTTAPITWSANSSTLIGRIQNALSLDPNTPGLQDDLLLSVVSPTIDIAPNARLIVLGPVDDNGGPITGDGTNSALAGGSDLYIAGGGELELNGSDTYRGSTYVNQGILTVGNSNALGAGPSSSATQAIALTNAVAGFTYFTLSFGGQTTGDILYNGTAADAATVQSDLAGLSSVGAGNVVVTQANPDVLLVTFSGSAATAAANGDTISPSIDAGASGMAGDVSGTTIVANIEGGADVADNAQIQLQGGITVNNVPLVIQGQGSNNEPTVQAFTVGGQSTGTYSLNFNGQTASGITYSASAAQIQADLQGLSSVGGAGGQVYVTQTGISPGVNDQQQLTINSSVANNATFQLSFGPTAYDSNVYTTTPPITYDANSAAQTAVNIEKALNALTNIGGTTPLGVLVGGATSVSGVDLNGGQQFTITFIGGLGDTPNLPTLEVVNNTNITTTHLQFGSLPTKTYEAVFQGSFSGVAEPVMTATAAAGGATVSAPTITVAGGSANATPDQWFSDSQGTGTSNTAIQNVQVDNVPGAANTTENGSGPVTDVLVSEGDPDVIYVATAGGGAWKTLDGGITWQPLFDSQFELDNPAVMFGGTLTQDPNNANIIFYGTGNNTNANDSYYGSGVYESTNGGATWTLLTDPTLGNPFNGMTIGSMIASPDVDGAVVVTANYGSAGFGAQGSYGDINGLSSGSNNGVWYFNGTNWQPVLTSTTGNTGGLISNFSQDNFSSLVYDNGGLKDADNTDLMVAVSSIDMNNNKDVGVYTTGANFFNNPAGATWANTNSFNTNAPVLEYQPDAPLPPDYKLSGTIMLAGNTSVVSGTQNSGVPTSNDLSYYAAVSAIGTNTGQLFDVQWLQFEPIPPNGTGTPAQVNTWTDIADDLDYQIPPDLNNVPDYMDTAGSYANAIAAYGNYVFLGGTDSGGGSFVLMSSNNGANWSTIATGGSTANGPGSSILSMEAYSLSASATPTTLYVTTDSGIWTYTVSSGTWTDITGNLADAQFDSASADPANPNVALAAGHSVGAGNYNLNTSTGAQSLSQTAGGGNNVLGGGGAANPNENGLPSFGGQIEYDPANPALAYFFTAGTLYRSTNANTADPTWTAVLAGPAQQFMSFALDPNNAQRIVVGWGNTLEESLNEGATWIPLDGSQSFVLTVGNVTTLTIPDFQGPFQDDPAFTDVPANPSNTADSSTYYLASTNDVFVSEDGGQTWVKNRGPALVGNTAIEELVVDPADAATVFAVTTGTSGEAGVGHVFESTNFGQSWTDITGGAAGLPDQSVWTLAIDPRNGNLYVGTDIGVYELAGGEITATNNWMRFGAGLPNVQVRDIEINTTANVMTIATYGRGMYQYYLDDTAPSDGAIRALSGNDTWTGPVALVGPTTIGTNGSQALQDGFSGATLTITGVISDGVPGSVGDTLTKIGGGNLALAGDNTYSGVTVVNDGNLIVQNPNALGAGGTPGTEELFLDDAVAGITSFTLSYNGASGSTVTIPYTGDGTTDAEAIMNALGSGFLPAGGTVASVTANATDTSFTIVLGGSLADSIQPLFTAAVTPGTPGAGFSAEAGSTWVVAGAALELESSLDDEPITLNGNGIQPPTNGHNSGALVNVSNNHTYAGTITLNTNSTIGVASGTLAIDPTSGDGIIDGGSAATAYSLTKEGAGTLVLDSPDTYQGDTYVTTGVLELENNNALGSGTATIVDDGAQLELQAPTGSSSLTIPVSDTLYISGIGTGTTGATAGALRNQGGNNSWLGQIFLASVPNFSSATTPEGVIAMYVAQNTVLTLPNTIAEGLPPIPAGGPPTTVNEPASSGLAEVGLGTLVLAGDNTFTGGTYAGYTFGNVNDSGASAAGLPGGTIDVQNANALGTDQNQEVQRIVTYDPPGQNDGYTLTFNGQTTAHLTAGENAATIQNDLNGLSSLGLAATGSTSAGSAVITNLEVGGLPLTSITQLQVGMPVTGANLNSNDTYYIASIQSLSQITLNTGVGVTAGANGALNLGAVTVSGTTVYNGLDEVQQIALTDPTSLQNSPSSLTATAVTAAVDPGANLSPSMIMNGTTASGSFNITALPNTDSIQNGTLTSGSSLVTGLTSTAALYLGEPVSGAGISPNTTILAIDSAGSVTLSSSATASGANSLTFFQTNLYVGEPISGPGIPANSTITAISSPNPTQVTFTNADGAGGTPEAATASNTVSLTFSATYYYAVTAVTPEGQSVPSSEASATTGAVVAMTATTVDASSSITLPVTPSPLLTVGMTVSGPGIPVGTTVVSDVGTTVTLSNPAGAGAGAGTVTFTPTSANMKAAANLSWSSVSGATSYDIYRSLVPGDFAQGLLASVSAGTTTYSDIGPVSLSAPTGLTAALAPTAGGALVASTPYYYVVTAVGVSGETLASFEATASTNNSQFTIDLAWNPVQGATSYNIYRSTVSGAFVDDLLASTTNTSYVDNGSVALQTFSPPTEAFGPPSLLTATADAGGALAPATTYYYAVASIGPAGVSVINAYPAVTTSSAAVGDLKVDLTWTPQAGVTGYDIYRSTTPIDQANLSNDLIAEVNGGTSSGYTDTGATLSVQGTTTNASAVISDLASTNLLAPGMAVTGTNIPTGAFIVSVNSATQITISASATGTGTGALIFNAVSSYTPPTQTTFSLSFNGLASSLSLTGNTTAGSANLKNVANASTVLADGMTVTGPGIQAGTTILNVVGTTVTLSLPAEATAVGQTFTFGTPAISYTGNAVTDANDILTALENLSTIGAGNITVTADPTDTIFTVTFQSTLSDEQQSLISATVLKSTAGAGVTELTAGDGGATYVYTVRFVGGGELTPLDAQPLITINKSSATSALTPGSSEVATGGFTTLVYTGSTLALDGDPKNLGDSLTLPTSTTIALNGLGVNNEGALYNASGDNTVPWDPNSALGNLPIGSLPSIILQSSSYIGAAANTQLDITGTIADPTLESSSQPISYADPTALPSSLTKVGAGTVVLDPAAAAGNTYTGTTNVNNGDLNIQTPHALGYNTSAVQDILVGATGSFELDFNSATLTPAISVGASAATVQADINALPNISIGGGSVTVTKSGNNFFVYFNNPAGAPGSDPLANVTQNLLGFENVAGAGVETLTSLVAGGASTTQVASSGSAATLQLDNAAGNGSGFSEESGKALYLSGAGFTGDSATVNLAGTTSNGSTVVTGIASTSQLVPGMAVTGANIPGGAVIVQVNSATQVTLNVAATGGAVGEPLAFIAVSGALENVFGTNTWGASTVTLGTNTTIGVDDTSSLTISQPIGDGGLGLGITKLGAGTLNFTGDDTTNNTYTGTTNVLLGTLNLSKTNGGTALDGNLFVGSANYYEQTQTLTFSNFATGDTYELVFDGESSGPITYLGGTAGDAAAIAYALNNNLLVVTTNFPAGSTPFSVAQVGNTASFVVTLSGVLSGTAWPEILGYTAVAGASIGTVLGGTTPAPAGALDSVLVNELGGSINEIVPSATVTVVDDGQLNLLAGAQQTVAALTMTSGDITLANGSVLTLAGPGLTGPLSASSDATGDAIIQEASADGTGELNLGANGHIFTVLHGAGATVTTDLLIGAIITGSAGNATTAVTKTGDGVLELSNENTYTGLTQINAGDVQVDALAEQIITLGGSVSSGNTFTLTYDDPSADGSTVSASPITTGSITYAGAGNDITTAASIQNVLNQALVGSNTGPVTVTVVGSGVYSVAFAGVFGINVIPLTITAVSGNFAGTTIDTVSNIGNVVLAGGSLSGTGSVGTGSNVTPAVQGPTAGTTPITAASWSAGGGGTATITAPGNNFVAGQSVAITGVTPTAYDGVYVIASVNTVNNTFTYSLPLGATPGNGTGFGAAAVVSTVNPGDKGPPITTGILQATGNAAWTPTTQFWVDLQDSAVLGATPATTLTGQNTPAAMALDSGGHVYIANLAADTVSEYAAGATGAAAPIHTFNVPGSPLALAIDSSGDLFVANGAVITEFAPNGSVVQTLSSGLTMPADLTFDSAGDLFVGDVGSANTLEYTAGQINNVAGPTFVRSGFGAMAFDSHGNLWVGYATAVHEYAAGNLGGSSIATINGFTNVISLAFDAFGNLYVADSGTGTVSEFAPGSVTAKATFSTGLNGPTALAFTKAGDLLVANYAAGVNTGYVSEFAPIPVTGANYDQLFVNGNVNLGSGYNPNTTASNLGALLTGTVGANIAVGDSFTILQATGSITGNFTEIINGVQVGIGPESAGFATDSLFIGENKFYVTYYAHSVVLTRALISDTVIVTPIANPVYGQNVTYTATVVPELGAPAPDAATNDPTATIVFEDAITSQTSQPIPVSNGTATWKPQTDATSTPAGSLWATGSDHQIVAIFSDGSIFSAGESYPANIDGTTISGNTVVDVSGSGLGSEVLAAGMSITGPGIPAGDTIASVGVGTITLTTAANATSAASVPLSVGPEYALTGSTTSGQTLVTGLLNTSALAVGMSVSGPGIPAGDSVASIAGISSINLAVAATATSAAPVNLTFGPVWALEMPGNTSTSSSTITNLPSNNQLVAGMAVIDPGVIPANTFIGALAGQQSITLVNANGNPVDPLSTVTDADLQFAQVVQKQNVTLTPVFQSTTPTYGQPDSVTVTVAPAIGANVPGALTPTGNNITLTVDGVSIGAASTTATTATFNLPTTLAVAGNNLDTAGNPHAVVVGYTGDANYKATTQSAGNINVNQDNTTISITPTPSVASVGQSTSFAIQVAPATQPSFGIAPEGTVAVYDGNPALTATTTSAGFTIPALLAPPVTITVASTAGMAAGQYLYINDGTNSIVASISSVVDLAHVQIDTATILAGSAGNTMASGAPVNLSEMLDPQTAVTSGAFAIPSGVNTTTLSINAAGSWISAGEYLNISDGTNTFIALVTATGSGTITVQTVEVLAGAGTNMGAGAAVLLATDPANGLATFSTSSLAFGTHQVYAVFDDGGYAGADLDYAGGQADDNSVSFTVQASTAITAFTASPASGDLYGETVNLTATIVSSEGIPTAGRVDFYDGAVTTTSSPNYLGSGTITLVTTPITAATWMNTAGGTATITANNSYVAGQLVRISGVTPTAYDGTFTVLTATGTSFTYALPLATNPGNGSAFGTAGIAQATLPTTALSVGTHTLSAQYNDVAPDNNYATSPTATLNNGTNNYTVSAATSKVTVTASPSNVATYGNTLTFIATVTAVAPGNDPTPMGSVSFSDSLYGLLGNGTQTGPNTWSFTTTATELVAASHTITATFTPSDGNLTGTNATGPNPGTLTNYVVAPASTSVSTPSPSPGSVVYGEPITFTSTVTGSGSGTPGNPLTGTVTFKDGSTVLGVVNLGLINSNVAQLTLNMPTLAAGVAHNITAVYAPPTAVTLTGTTNGSTSVTGLSSTAGLSPGMFVTGPGIPGGTTIATVGTGSITLSQAATGSGTVSLSFGANFAGDTSLALSQTVNPAQTTVAVASSTAPSNTVGLNQTVTYTATVDTAAPSTVVPVSAGTVTFYDVSPPPALTTTKATFGITNVGVSTGPISVNSTTGMADGSLLEISDGTNAIVGSITSFVTNSSVTLTTVAVLQGSGTMGSGASVSSAVKLNATPITVSASGQASVSTSYTTQLGAHTIWAAYSPPTATPINYAGSAGKLTETVLKTATLTGVTAVSNTWGQSLAYHITVSSPQGGTPTGTVTAVETVNLTGTTTATSASVTVSSTTLLTTGMTVTGAGIPSGTTITVTGPTTITLSQAATATASNVPLTFTIQRGNVGTLSAGSTTITIGADTLVAGTHSLTFTYVDTTLPTPIYAQASATISQVVAPAGTTVTLASSTAPSTEAELGQTVTFTATLKVNATNPVGSPGLPTSGTVTLKDGTTTLVAIPLTGSNQTVGATTVTYNGTTSVTISYVDMSLTQASHAITAVYSGSNPTSPNFSASNTASLTETVVADGSLGALSATAWTQGATYTGTIPYTWGGTAKIIAGVSTVAPPGSSNAVLPGLTVTFVNNASNSTIKFSGAPTTPGFYPFAIYVTDTAGITVSKNYSLVVNAAPTLSPAGNATSPGAALPGGTYKSAYSTTIAINGGTAAFKSLSVTGLPTGLTYSLSGSTIRIYGTPTAPNVYSSVHVSVLDAAGVAATGTYSITINPAATTVTALSVSSLTPLEGVPVVFTAVVSSSAGTPYAATGKLAFYDSSLGFLGYGTVVSDTATTATYQLHYTYATSGFSGAGSRSITAQYLGSNPTSSATELFGQSPVSNALAVNVVNTQMTLTASTTTPNPNQLVTFTATLTVVGAVPQTGDVVDFYENGVMIGSATITGSGPTYKVTFTRAFPAGQLDTITASFAGDAGSLDAASNSIEINTKSTLR